MLYRLLYILVGSAIIAAAGAATYLCSSPEAETAGLVVEQAEQELHSPVVGRRHEVHFRINNPTGQVHRIIGVGFV